MKITFINKALFCLLVFISNIAFAIDPPKISASGNQVFCSGSSLKIIETITITHDPSEPSTEAMYVQISTGYSNPSDLLRLENSTSHPKITSSWDASAGKLKLYSPTGVKITYTDFIEALKDVSYSNSSIAPSGSRTFSITLGQANYLPSTGHYYQFVPSLGITWNTAKAQAETMSYYGLKGYLATLTSLEETKLCGEQSNGAGWIGGTDEKIEGQWRWVTGPEGLANGGNGIVFWNGVANGSTPNFAYWNTNEPNQLGNEDYAHITALGVGIPGSWNDLSLIGEPSGNYQPKGYIVEYGGMPGDPTLQLSASTSITIRTLTVTPPNKICPSQSTTIQTTTNASEINWYDAQNGGNFLGTGNNFTTPPLLSDTTYYIDYGCAQRKAITVQVENLPVAHPVIIARKCDDNHDGIYSFDTTTLESTLLNGQSNVTVKYLDATNNPLKDANGNLITSPFPATFTTKSQTIQAVVSNNSTLQCSSKTTIVFIVDDLPEAFPLASAITSTCDDEAISTNQDGKFAFDTSSFESIILNGQTGMTITYTDGNGMPLSSPLPNPFFTASQNVTAQVKNNTNPSCFASTTLRFVVLPRPIVKDVEIIQCDADLVVDGKTFFNLTIKNTEISTNSSNEDFNYYTSLPGAQQALVTDLIPNPIAFENPIPTQMEVWTRVSNPITGCFSVAKITLKVPATNINPNLKIPFAAVCDDFLDTNGNNTANNNDRDGIATFNLSPTKRAIEALLPSTDVYTITYYKNQSDALAESNPILDISNYRNIDAPHTQDIWIRIDSSLDNACFGLGPYVTLKVEKLPVAHQIALQNECDDDTDGIVIFDTSTLESAILQGQNNVSITYFDQNNMPLVDADGVLITSPFPPTFKTTSQTVKAVVTNTTIQKCEDETTIQFAVNATPVAYPIPTQFTIVCDNEKNPLEQDGTFSFDTSAFESILLGGQTGMVIEYYDSNNAQLDSPLPNPFVTNSQTITAIVSNPANPICKATTTLDFVVQKVPNININLDGSENKLICSNLSTFFVTLDAGIVDGTPTTNYSYSWKKDGTDLGINLPTLEVNTEGIYTVEVTNAQGCSRERTITVTASNVATIVSVDVVDLTDVNSVTVIVSGPGNYQFSLDEPDGFWQESNVFVNVASGMHEVYVKDKNGCGIVSKAIAVVGIPKYFTPNGDGYNDVWNIKGITKFPQTEVQIFDRFGRLIKVLNASNAFWDGTLNGVALPADDYWYVVNLNNGKPVIKGHFSLKR